MIAQKHLMYLFYSILTTFLTAPGVRRHRRGHCAPSPSGGDAADRNAPSPLSSKMGAKHHAGVVAQANGQDPPTCRAAEPGWQENGEVIALAYNVSTLVLESETHASVLGNAGVGEGTNLTCVWRPHLPARVMVFTRDRCLAIHRHSNAQ